MARRPPARCRHRSGGSLPCSHCGRWTCLDCHHADWHLSVCPPTKKEARR